MLPAEFTRCLGWEGGIQVGRNGEEDGSDILRLQLIGFLDAPQQLLGRFDDGFSIIDGDGDGAPNPSLHVVPPFDKNRMETVQTVC